MHTGAGESVLMTSLLWWVFRYSKPRISEFLKRTLKRKTFFSSE